MKTIKDWANYDMPYRFKLRKAENEPYDTDMWECWFGLGKDSAMTDHLTESGNWSCLGIGKTKPLALSNAIIEWNQFDQHGRYQ